MKLLRLKMRHCRFRSATIYRRIWIVPWLVFNPGAVIIWLALAINLVGNALRDVHRLLHRP